MPISPEQLQTGGIAFISLFLIKELFTYLKSRKNGNGYVGKEILKELQEQNKNHLHTISQEMNMGFDRIVETSHLDNMKIIEILARIDGKLK